MAIFFHVFLEKVEGRPKGRLGRGEEREEREERNTDVQDTHQLVAS